MPRYSEFPDSARNSTLGYTHALDGSGQTLVVAGSSTSSAVMFYQRENDDWILTANRNGVSVSDKWVVISHDGSAVFLHNHKGSNTTLCGMARETGGYWPDNYDYEIRHNIPDISYFGMRIAISSNGDVIAIQVAPKNSQGRQVYLSDKSSGYKEFKLIPSSFEGKSSMFGFGMKFYHNDSGLIISDPQSSSIFPYEYKDGVWQEPAASKTIKASGEKRFAWSLDIDHSGTVIVAGGQDHWFGIRIYSLKDEVWVLEYSLKGGDKSDRESYGVGEIVRISSDGKVIVSSSTSGLNEGGQETGAVWIFTKRGDNWSLLKKVTPETNENIKLFGSSVDISPDGRFITVGVPDAPGYHDGEKGRVWIYEAVIN